MTPQTNNPFWLSGLIKDPKQFFDREREKSRIRLYLTKNMSCQIVGPPSIGKSSLLYNIQNFASEWDPALKVAYLDLQDEECRKRSDIYVKAAEAWGIKEASPNPETFSSVIKNLSKRGFRMVLCLDEFGQLTRHPEEFTIDFFLGLRALAQQAGLTIFTSARLLLNELIPAYHPSSPFFNIFQLLRIGPFSIEDAVAFITTPRQGVPPFLPDEQSAILNFADGHPLALQVACFNVLLAKQSGEDIGKAMETAQDELKARLDK